RRPRRPPRVHFSAWAGHGVPAALSAARPGNWRPAMNRSEVKSHGQAGPGGQILVVDDEPLIRDTLAEFLTQEGFRVSVSGRGEEALEQAASHRFDVALCDVQLPGIDGLELLDRLLKISPQTFVVLITAYATVESAIAAFQRGAHDYLMKPILLEDVLVK